MKTETTPSVSLDTPANVCPRLVTILSWPRAHGSGNELAFRQWMTKLIAELGYEVVVRQDNLTVTVGKSPTTLFSCHMDTVGDKNAPSGEIKNLTYDQNMGIIQLDKGSIGGSLGADDGVGVWIMLHMIEKGIPGEYVFHVGEEVGCIGSRAMATKEPMYLKQFDAAIAFDRPNDYEVIITQGGLECASVKYGTALVKALNDQGLAYETSTKGMLTDTKMYRCLIPECINIGVGYADQHGTSEWLNYEHALKLRDAVCLIAWDALPVDRDHTLPDPKPAFTSSFAGSYYDRYNGQSGYHGGYADKDLFWDKDDAKAKVAPIKKPKGKAPVYEALDSAFDELKDNKRDDLMVFAEDDPEAMVDTMIRLMREIAQLRADIAYMETLT